MRRMSLGTRDYWKTVGLHCISEYQHPNLHSSKRVLEIPASQCLQKDGNGLPSANLP